MLDENETIEKLQSSTVRAALIAMIINILTLFGIFTGKVFDIEAIKQGLELGLPAIINIATVYLGWKAYKGRVSADKKIDPESSLFPTKRKD